MASEEEIMQAMMHGINFGSGRKKSDDDTDKVKTKARKKAYHTGAHNSGAARHKAEIRQRVKNRASQKKKK
ncbi:MAG: hypothetical protein IKG96_05565 [Bacteroidaceae bacterium]|nr:hypothetical protein [Bacteroidaceae bacterium]